jgi:hypothetical protein
MPLIEVTRMKSLIFRFLIVFVLLNAFHNSTVRAFTLYPEKKTTSEEFGKLVTQLTNQSDYAGIRLRGLFKLLSGDEFVDIPWGISRGRLKALPKFEQQWPTCKVERAPRAGRKVVTLTCQPKQPVGIQLGVTSESLKLFFNDDKLVDAEFTFPNLYTNSGAIAPDLNASAIARALDKRFGAGTLFLIGSEPVLAWNDGHTIVQMSGLWRLDEAHADQEPNPANLINQKYICTSDCKVGFSDSAYWNKDISRSKP